MLEFIKLDSKTLINCAIVIGGSRSLIGFSGTDQDLFYTQLKESVNQVDLNPITNIPQNLNVRLAFLSDSDGSNIKECIKSINSQLTTKSSEYLDYDIEALVSEYSNHGFKIAIVIQSFETFDPKVLQRLLEIFRLRKELDACFVLGISTNLDCLHNNLSKCSIELLNTKVFSLTKSKDLINMIVKKVVLMVIITKKDILIY